MAEPLKHFFNAELVAELSDDFVRVGLDMQGFTAAAVEGLQELELLDRARHIARALRPYLAADPRVALDQLVASFGPVLTSSELNGLAPFRYLPHAVLISELGMGFPDAGLRACWEITQRFTAEWCIRPYVEVHPEPTWAALRLWVHDPSPHVRRLVSEGLRPRLPWASRLRTLQADPRPSLELLQQLRDDPEEYVRRSVANHLGDIAKDHPDLAVQVAQSWAKDATPTRRRLLRHALRHLVKQGHSGALGVLGHHPPDVRISDFQITERAREGDTVPFSFRVHNLGPDSGPLEVDVVVHFVKASGRTRAKVFKVGRVELSAGADSRFQGRIRVTAMTTRRHHPGCHRVEVQVNGLRFPGGEFRLEPGPTEASAPRVRRPR